LITIDRYLTHCDRFQAIKLSQVAVRKPPFEKTAQEHFKTAKPSQEAGK
jgi:hypothetical protein